MAEALWEILVPKCSNGGVEYPIAHHHAWDEYVRSRSGGLTILKTAKGQWVSPEDELFIEPMIPVRVHCDRRTIEEIVDFTLAHYDQKAVMAYRISDEVILKHRA